MKNIIILFFSITTSLLYCGVDGLAYPLYWENTPLTGAGTHTNMSHLKMLYNKKQGEETNIKWATTGTYYYIYNLDTSHTNQASFVGQHLATTLMFSNTFTQLSGYDSVRLQFKLRVFAARDSQSYLYVISDFGTSTNTNKEFVGSSILSPSDTNYVYTFSNINNNLQNVIFYYTNVKYNSMKAGYSTGTNMVEIDDIILMGEDYTDPGTPKWVRASTNGINAWKTNSGWTTNSLFYIRIPQTNTLDNLDISGVWKFYIKLSPRDVAAPPNATNDYTYAYTNYYTTASYGKTEQSIYTFTNVDISSYPSRPVLVYVWYRDRAGNVNHNDTIHCTLNYDPDPPDQPILNEEQNASMPTNHRKYFFNRTNTVFASVPQVLDTGVSMSSGSNAESIEYRFMVKTNNIGDSSSGVLSISPWTPNNFWHSTNSSALPYWHFSGLATTNGITSAYKTNYYFVQARDPLGNTTPWSSPIYSIQDDWVPATTMYSEPNFTKGLINQVKWQGITDADENYPGGGVGLGFANGKKPYKVIMATNIAFIGNIVDSGWISTTNYTFSSLIHGEEYFYRVVTKDMLGNTNLSPIVKSTQDNHPPKIIRNITANNVPGFGNVVLAWSEPLESTSHVIFYNIWRATSGVISNMPVYPLGFNDFHLLTNASGEPIRVTNTAYTDYFGGSSGLIEGYYYYYYAVAADSVSNICNSNELSQASNFAAVQVDKGPPYPMAYQFYGMSSMSDDLDYYISFLTNSNMTSGMTLSNIDISSVFIQSNGGMLEYKTNHPLALKLYFSERLFVDATHIGSVSFFIGTNTNNRYYFCTKTNSYITNNYPKDTVINYSTNKILQDGSMDGSATLVVSNFVDTANNTNILKYYPNLFKIDTMRPVNVKISNITAKTVFGMPMIVWSAITDFSGIYDYKIYRSSSSNRIGTNIGSVLEGGTLSFTDTNARNGLYYYFVKARDNAGNLSKFTNDFQYTIRSYYFSTPKLTNFRVITNSEVNKGNISFIVDLTMPANLLCSLELEFSTNGVDWTSGSILGTYEAIYPDKDITLQWISAKDQPGRTGYYYLRLTPYNYEEVSDTGTRISGNPVVSKKFKIQNDPISIADNILEAGTDELKIIVYQTESTSFKGFIYDMKGLIVYTFEEKNLNSGPNELIWDLKKSDGTLAGTGLYFVHMYYNKTHSLYKIFIIGKKSGF